MQTPLCVVGSYRLDAGVGSNTWRGTDLQTELPVRVCLVDTNVAMACHGRCEVEHPRLVPVRSVILPQRSLLPPNVTASRHVDAFVVLDERPGISLANVVQSYGTLLPTAAVGLAILIGDALLALESRGLRHGAVVADAILLPTTPGSGMPLLSLVGSTRRMPAAPAGMTEPRPSDQDMSGLLGCLLYSMTGNRFRGVPSSTDGKALFVSPGARPWGLPFAQAVQSLHEILRRGFCLNPHERYASLAMLHADLSAWLDEHGDTDPFEGQRRSAPSSSSSPYSTQQGDSLAAHEISWGHSASSADDRTLPSPSSLPPPLPSFLKTPVKVRSAEATGPFSPTHLRLLQEERAWALVQPVLESMLSQRPLSSSRSGSLRVTDSDREPTSLPSTTLMRQGVALGDYNLQIPPRGLRLRFWKRPRGERLPPALTAFLITLGAGLFVSLLLVNLLQMIADRRRRAVGLYEPREKPVVPIVVPERKAALVVPVEKESPPLASALPPPPVTPQTTARCLAGAFPPATFQASESFPGLCLAENAVEASRILRKALVLGNHSPGPSRAMVEWWRYGWYEVPVVASLRAVCCPNAPPLHLPPTPTSSCPSLPDAVAAITAAVRVVDDTPIQAATNTFSQVASCLDPIASSPAHPTKSGAHASQRPMFERFLERLRQQTPTLTGL